MPPSDVLRALALPLPPAPKPVGAYTPSLRMGNLLYTSGHLPLLPDGSLGKAAARQVACAILATVENALGSVDRVKRVVKVLGMVNCTPDFTKQPHVLNGCSELFAEIWGREAGIGVRSAFGVAALPENVPVEIEAVFEVE